MSRFTRLAAAGLMAGAIAGGAQAASPPAAPLTNLGRIATDKEIAAWDIDVRPDFKGLPKGSGSVAAGMRVWEEKCASCHGTFGESNEVFTPLVGGTGPEDVKAGRVASLTNGRQPQKTTLMKVATVSTLWDYINRAMPWTAPKSLTISEVYAVTAYLLNMGEIVPDDFVLSDQTMAEAQRRMPNRDGMSTRHGLWDVKGKPDVHSVACMKDCPVETTIRSSLPEASRNAHGNLALQNRTFGAVRGVDTTRPAPAGPLLAMSAAPAAATGAVQAAAPSAGVALMQKNGCTACHGVGTKIVGPGFRQVADRYRTDPAAAARLLDKLRKGGSGSWGAVAMPPQSQVSTADGQALVKWILEGAQ